MNKGRCHLSEVGRDTKSTGVAAFARAARSDSGANPALPPSFPSFLPLSLVDPGTFSSIARFCETLETELAAWVGPCGLSLWQEQEHGGQMACLWKSRRGDDDDFADRPFIDLSIVESRPGRLFVRPADEAQTQKIRSLEPWLALAAGNALRHFEMLQRCRESARRVEISRGKSERLGQMVAGLGHDLRSAQTAIASYWGLMESGQYSGEKRRKLTESLTAKFEILDTLTSELMNLPKLTSAPLDLREHDTEVLVQQAAEQVESLRLATGGTLVLPSNFPVVKCDGPKMIRVIQNLMANALVHHAADSPPEVQVELRCGRRNWKCTVSDRGPGVPKEERHRIFSIYVGEPGRGTGVGLSVAAALVELHGGRIWVGTRSGGGSRFHVKLPVEPQLGFGW